jgi:hypothetical protein
MTIINIDVGDAPSISVKIFDCPSKCQQSAKQFLWIPGKETLWIIGYLVLIGYFGLYAHPWLKVNLKAISTKRLVESTSKQAGETDTDTKNPQSAVTVSASKDTQRFAISEISPSPQDLMTAWVYHALCLFFLLSLGKLCVKIVENYGTWLSLSVILPLVIADFLILWSLAITANGYWKAQANLRIPRDRLDIILLFRLSNLLAMLVMIVPWYWLWSVLLKK